ncbi:hypothetical protein BZA70DRAFT_66204 [Myxozyma melibiosi]|uniref:SH3 domain-containing protein n=1 Tax=Myxozyma melibiosi TaxID=54550 RepID=A0ABR1F313_9ASCO
MADAKTQIDSVIAAATARAYEDSSSTSDDDDNNAAQHTAAEHVDDSSDEDDMMDDPYLSSSPSIYDECTFSSPQSLSSLSISTPLTPAADINYDLVYALHTFRATQKGHADALKGDAMIMLDDTNEYWWLVRMMKDSSVGYLPAEHIETPTERLARLNKHRNTEVSISLLFFLYSCSSS